MRWYKKKIILIYFWVKITLKNNHNHTSKHISRDILHLVFLTLCKLNTTVWFIGIVYKKVIAKEEKLIIFLHL